MRFKNLGDSSQNENERMHILQAFDKRLPEEPNKAAASDNQVTRKDDSIDEAKEKDHSASLAETLLNNTNSVLGSGLMSMSYALKESGLVLGLFCLMLVATLTDYSLVLLMKSGQLVGATTYQELMTAAFGTPGFIIISIFQFTYPFIAMIGYNVIVGDTLTTVFVRVTGIDSNSFFAGRVFIIIVCSICVTIPISLYRNIGQLAKASLLSLIITVVIAICIYVRLFTTDITIPDYESTLVYFNLLGFPNSFGVISFAFMVHHNSFMMYSSLADKSIERWKKVTNFSIAFSYIIFTVYAVGGYATFVGFTQGDLTNNYCWHDDLMNLCRLLFAVIIALTYPMECFVCREVIENILCQRLGVLSEERRKSWPSHLTLTVILVTAAGLLSLTTGCLGLIMSLNGLFAAVPLAYILPCLCYCKVSNDPLLSKDKILSMILAAVGIAVVINGLGILLYQEKEFCFEDQEMPYCQIVNVSSVTPKTIIMEAT